MALKKVSTIVIFETIRRGFQHTENVPYDMYFNSLKYNCKYKNWYSSLTEKDFKNV